MQTQIEPKQKTTAADHEEKLEHERERAERLMAALLRAKADALEARATLARLEGEIAALRSRPWSHWLTGWKRQPNVDSVPPPFARGDLLTYTARLALVLSVAATTAVLIGALNVSHNKRTASVATAAQELRAPVNGDEDRSTAAADAWRNETTASVATAAQELRAPVNADEDRSTAAADAWRDETTTSAAAVAQEVQAPVDVNDDKVTPAAKVWRNETTASVAPTAQEMPASVGGEALNISHNETTSAPPIDVPQASEQQKVDPPSAMVSTRAPADTAAAAAPVSKKTTHKRLIAVKGVSKKSAAAKKLIAVKPISKKPAAEKMVAKRAAAAARQRSTATRERASVTASIWPHPGYAAVF
jgi:hypothetical protein